MPIPRKHFYMIRHGETEANAAQIMAGSTDSPLTPLGRSQADAARLHVEALQKKPAIIVHSHLSRARETAEIINKNLNLPMIEDADYAEMHVGDWEGKSWDYCKEGFYGGHNPPNGETHQEFTDRIIRAKNKALSLEKTPPLIVCHGGVFRNFSSIYALNAINTNNCHLHEFTPVSKNGSFPWNAQNFHFDEKLISSPADGFHSKDA